jgi:hypothetical protein
MKFDKEGKRDWNVETNRKVRDIRDKFSKEPIDERILHIHMSPLTLAWKETYMGGDTINDYDETDMTDATDISGKRNEEHTK